MSLILKQESSANVPTPPAGKGTLFLNNSDQVVVKDSAGNTSVFPTVTTSNTQIVFNANGVLTGDSNLTFDNSNDTLTVSNLTVTGTLNAGDISVSSIANGTSNVDIVGTSGNVTISVAGNANVLTVTGTQVIASGNLTAANANLGNVVTGNYFTGVLTYAAQPNITSLGTLTNLYVGATSSNVDFANAKAIASQDNVGNSAADNIGLVGEGVANGTNTNITGIGLLGHARVANATKATGVQGQAFVTNTADTGAAVGIRGYSVDTHSGGYNIGILGNAMGSGVGNYAFYIQNGGIASIENATFWDLTDNSNAALTFNSTGKANIFGIETTDTAEGIFTSGYLNVVGNISAAGIKTNNYYYANGSPVDFQQAAGSNTQIQYNSANDFGASANFTFNDSTNVLTVTGNISTGNVSASGAVSGTTLAGTLTTASQPNITSVGTLTSATVSGNVTAGNVYANSGTVGATNLTGTLTTAAQPNITSVGTLTSATVSGNVTAGNVYANSGTIGANVITGNTVGGTLTTASQPNITSVGTLSSVTVSGNANVGNLNATSAVIASTLTSNVATGTAPLTVSSTTRVSNLNVAYANVSDFGVVTSQSTGTYYPAFINGSSTANYALAANSGFSANLANGGLTATTFVGNLSGNVLGDVANGTSSLSIPSSGGNVNISAAGNANVFTVTGTGVNVAGTLNATGNANVGNLGATGVVATTLGGTLTTAAQPNITSVGTLTSAAVTGNVTAGNVYANTGTIGASLLTGTLTTAAQPNVTSLGTLTSLTVTGNVSGGNLVTGGVLNSSGSSQSNIAGNLSMGTKNIINLADPVNAQDAATKNYVDAALQGLHVHDSCYVATTGTLAIASSGSTSYNNGSSGVGATITTTGTFLNIDGANVQTAGTRILVKNEANAAWNGIYTYTNTTTLTRATDFDTSAEAAGGDFVFVTSGSTQADTGWVQTTDNPTIGTSNIVWTQFSGAGTYTAGTGLTLSGTVFSITNTAVSAASYGNGDRVASFTVNAQGQLTAASNVVIAANAANLTGTTLASSIVTSSLTTVGTVTTGIWNNNIGSSATFAAGLSGANLASITGGNVSGQVANALVAGTVYTAAQPNITSVGTLTSLAVTGTTTSGNFATAGNITASFLVSNVATGTAPLTVSSTTRVANLNVAYANVSDYDVISVASSGTYYPQLINGSTAGNYQSYTNSAFSFNTATGALSATLLGGTLTTAAQPNVTSLGTLTSLGVNGTVTAVAFTANTGVFTGNANGLSSLQGTNVTGTLNSTTLGNSTLYVGTTAIALNRGSGSQSLTGITSIDGYASTVSTAAQPNITSTGTLTSLTVSGNITAQANITVTNNVIHSVATGISAAGSTQGTATAITKDINVVSTVSSGQGVILPTAVAGMRLNIMNTSANALSVYPATNGIINSLSANAAFSLAAGGRLDFIATTTTQWYTLNATYA